MDRNCGIVPGSELVLSRECLEAFLLIDEQFGCCMDDCDWILRMSNVGRYVFLNKTLAIIHYNEIPRKVSSVLDSTQKFLEKHAFEFEKRGSRYKAKVFADHFTRLACVCASQKEYRMGGKYLLRSLTLNPLQRPVPILLVLLTMMDKLLGSRTLNALGELRRRTRNPRA